MIVLKLGGDIFESGMNLNLSKDIKKTLRRDSVIIVHGGGDEVTRVAEKLGKRQVFVTSPSGIRSRYTDEETVRIYTMVMAGRVNKAIVRWLLSEGVPAIGVSGVDAAILRARRKKRLLIIDERGRKRIIEGGFTGKIIDVDPIPLSLLVQSGYVPVVAPIAIGEEYELLNVDSDRAAAYLAGGLRAESIIFLTDVRGVIMDGDYLERLSLEEAENLLPKVGPGMDKKVLASIEALRAGVKEAIISSGFVEDPITSALDHKVGTVITLG
ncbi:MAG: acetylglutamate/acetylaminoadipate kinase [Candidatus Bathyarchaeota archaeon B26-2]|nr:MAG: acetylglutamate/acetylaminoadipate kinase [Candidatus Bathyarchaeota archaeon B26-2]